MREAARALDDVSDHLGEVLRRADDLLVEWSRFGAQVRDQVEREAAAIGGVVDGAVARAAAGGIDRAIGDRLRALTTELERLEQRTRAASRAAVEQRAADRRILWAVVAGIVLANALLVVLILRKPDPAPAAEPIRLDAAAQPAEPSAPAPGATPDPATGATAGSSAAAAADAAAGALLGYGVGAAPGGVQGPSAGSTAGPNGGPTAGSGAPAPPGGAPRPAEAGSRLPAAPARPGAAHPHKKSP